MSRGRLRRALKAVRDYIRYDLREIVAPRSLPDPPGRVLPKRLTLKDYWQVQKMCLRRSFAALGRSLQTGTTGDTACRTACASAQAAKEATVEYKATWRSAPQEEPGKAGAAGAEQADEADRPGQGPGALLR
jgi:hypothetical protein